VEAAQTAASLTRQGHACFGTFAICYHCNCRRAADPKIIKQSKAKQSKSKAKQNKTKQSKAKQNKTRLAFTRATCDGWCYNLMMIGWQWLPLSRFSRKSERLEYL
jgi:hypothetical protein